MLEERFDLRTPVALFGYNRPEHTRQVLERIRDAEPPLLLFVADGPQPDDPTDQERTKSVRNLVSEQSFPFEVRTEFADENLGLKRRFSTGLDWVFEEVPEAIILEDDIVPEPSFFRYCQLLLDRFRDDDRVMEITGRNQLEKWKRCDYDYHFLFYGGIWGWATWRDAWEEFDPDMELWSEPTVRDRVRDLVSEPEQFRYLKRVYDSTAAGKTESWAYAWGFTRHLNSGFSVVPSRNLVKNIGIGEKSTNTQNVGSGLAGKDTFNLEFPLSHPPYVAVDREYDNRFHRLRPARWKVMPVLHYITDALGL
jgi:hypothetical protein